jgi:hypothetical protein
LRIIILDSFRTHRIGVVSDGGVGQAVLDGHGLRFGRFRAAPEPGGNQSLGGIEDSGVVSMLSEILRNFFFFLLLRQNNLDDAGNTKEGSITVPLTS